ncbi:MAG TPA: hypothetical protein VMF08_13860 [Candidatus Sulfotelmatobacter sp.]|nr:hypothetical protein [Candidatus Sulfotelmatobacter sp.]
MADPPIYVAAIIANLKPSASDGFDEVQVITPSNSHEYNVIRTNRRWIARLKRNQIAVVDFAAHRVATWTDLNRLTSPQCLNCKLGPTHVLSGLISRAYDSNRARHPVAVPAVPSIKAGSICRINGQNAIERQGHFFPLRLQSAGLLTMN